MFPAIVWQNIIIYLKIINIKQLYLLLPNIKYFRRVMRFITAYECGIYDYLFQWINSELLNKLIYENYKPSDDNLLKLSIEKNIQSYIDIIIKRANISPLMCFQFNAITDNQIIHLIDTNLDLNRFNLLENCMEYNRGDELFKYIISLYNNYRLMKVISKETYKFIIGLLSIGKSRKYLSTFVRRISECDITIMKLL